jgi:N-acyl homoserine lactone hydrolase
MSNLVINPIPLVKGSNETSKMTYGFNFGKPFDYTGYVWYISGAGDRILVDGGASIDYLRNVRGVMADEVKSIEAGLGELGLGLEDIDIIIATHLHHDHIAQASLFPKARVIVQRKELEFARNPHPSCIEHFDVRFLEGLNFKIIEGDARICEVFSTPGHTVGGQSVSVQTDRGNAVISGMCTIKENFYPPPPISDLMPVITPGILTNTLEAYDSTLKIKEMADIIITLHDSEFREKKSIP